MNSPDYEDFIDMFSVPTPISPLPPTPIASPSHEASEDVIYDALPPWSNLPQFTVFESPLKDSHGTIYRFRIHSVIHRSSRSKERWHEEKEERRNEKRWHEEPRPRDPRLYKRPPFRPPYPRHPFKPRGFQRPPYAQQLMPTSQENAQVFFHSQGLAVLCIRTSGFTLTNGVVSYAMDRECRHELFKFLHYLNVGTICVTDQHSKQTFKDIQASWSSSSPFKRTPVMLLNANGRELGQSHFHDRDARDAAREDRRFGICRSAGTRPGVHPLPGAQYQTSVCLVLQRQLASKKTLLDNFKRAILEAKHVNEFRPDDVLWEKISKGMLRNPDRLLKNTDKRMVYMYNNMFFVKKDFTFGCRTVKSGEIHLIQTTHVPMLIYELPSSSLRCRANPNLFRRSFEPFDQMLYHRMVLEPHTAYPIPAGTRYILLTVQKTMFGVDIIPERMLPQLLENGFHLGDFRQRKRFDQKAYKLPPPTPAHVPAETHKRPLEQQPKPLSKKKRVIITPIIRPSVPSVRIIKPSTALSTPQPVSIPDPSPEQTTPQILLPDPPVVETTSQIHLPDPPEQTTSQILLPDPPEQTTSEIHLPDPPESTTSQILLPDPPSNQTTSQIYLPEPPSNQTTSQIYLPDPNVVEALEPTLTDDSSIDQIMSSVFGDYLPQGIPSAHSQDPQVLDTVPSLFDENNDLISFLDYFEAGLAMEQQETPMDLTMPRMKKKSDKHYWI
ncbi:uncharacterized protein TNCV_1986211 [Trichonephila clavipes]|nr:uncharacterized protein TNCV_1986211 [Trichonephila clavipes]